VRDGMALGERWYGPGWEMVVHFVDFDGIADSHV
jgi:hypothetical protein